MARFAAGVVVLGLGAVGCHSGESVLVDVAPPSEVAPGEPAPRPMGVASSATPEIGADEVVVALFDERAEITMPREAAARAGRSPTWYGVEVVWKVSVSVSLVDGPAPAVIEGQRARAVRELGHGVTEAGMPWSVSTFDARMGTRSAGGQVHFFVRVARYESALALDDHSHLRCTGGIEHDVSGVDDEAIARVQRICESLRPTASRN